MKDVTKLFLLTLGLGVAAGHTAHAQLGVGNGSTAPRTMLDVNGALSVTEATAAVSANAATIPTSFGLVRLTGSPTAAVALTTAATPVPVAGQHLVVVNPTTQPATLAGQNIPAGQALAFVYSNGGWAATAGGGNAANFYSADGSLASSRNVAMGANNLTFNSTTGRTILAGNGSTVQGLDLVNASSGTAAHTRLGLFNDTGAAFLYLNSSARVDGTNSFNALTLRNDVGDLRLQSKGGAGLTVAATTGNVGVNTPIPTYTLDVTGTARTTGMAILNTGLVIDNNNGNNGTLTSGNANNNHITFGLNSGEAIGSARSGTNTMGLDFYTQFAKRMSITQGGYVGIGTATPAYPLDVNTIGGTLAGAYAYYALNTGNNTVNTGIANTTGSVSIRAMGRIAASEFNAFSDARLKSITGLSDSKRDLGLLQQIEITDYQMKDKAQYGDKAFKKVIAQQVEKVYPLAVNKGNGFVPSIYSTSTVAPAAARQSLVTLVAPHNLQVGDKVKLIGERNGTVETTVTAVASPRSFAVALPQPETKLFVFGPEVKDLRTVDYEALAMLNVSATQELAKQVAALQATNAQLTAANDSLKASLAEKATASTLGEMQAALQALRAEVQSLKGAGITASAK